MFLLNLFSELLSFSFYCLNVDILLGIYFNEIDS
jgi:hypothetical protein